MNETPKEKLDYLETRKLEKLKYIIESKQIKLLPYINIIPSHRYWKNNPSIYRLSSIKY